MNWKVMLGLCAIIGVCAYVVKTVDIKPYLYENPDSIAYKNNFSYYPDVQCEKLAKNEISLKNYKNEITTKLLPSIF